MVRPLPTVRGAGGRGTAFGPPLPGRMYIRPMEGPLKGGAGVSVSRVHFKNVYVSRVTRQNPVSLCH